MTFPVVIYGCESWTIKKAEHLRIDAFKLWCWRNEEIKTVSPKGNQPWIFIRRTDAEDEVPIFVHLIQRVNSVKKTDAGKDWGQEEKAVREDELVGWHHQLNGYESERTLGDSEGQGRLVYCSLWGYKESDTIANEQQQMHSTWIKSS